MDFKFNQIFVSQNFSNSYSVGSMLPVLFLFLLYWLLPYADLQIQESFSDGMAVLNMNLRTGLKLTNSRFLENKNGVGVLFADSQVGEVSLINCQLSGNRLGMEFQKKAWSSGLQNTHPSWVYSSSSKPVVLELENTVFVEHSKVSFSCKLNWICEINCALINK